MNEDSSDISLNTGDFFKIDFPGRLREDGKHDEDKVKYCIPLINTEGYNLTDYWNFDTTSIVLTTSRDYPKGFTIGVEIPEDEYDFIPEGTYIICSQIYTIPINYLEEGEKLGTLSVQHTNEVRIAAIQGHDLFPQNISEEESTIKEYDFLEDN